MGSIPVGVTAFMVLWCYCGLVFKIKKVSRRFLNGRCGGSTLDGSTFRFPSESLFRVVIWCYCGVVV